jgi:alkylation response protein AidB-like acyl-CoA dehydrogenase
MSFQSPRDQALALRQRWSARTSAADDQWPAHSWQDLCSDGVTRWMIPVEFGGDDQPAAALTDGCLELARSELLVTFVLSQFQAACLRLAVAKSDELKSRWLPDLAAGKKFGTVGISHLTTSRQHTAPAVSAVADGDGFRLTGEIPWVTGSRQADVIVLGGAFADGRQILAAVPSDRAGLLVGEPMRLLALTGSETGPIHLNEVAVQPEEIIAGPIAGVIQHASGGGAGSLMTSTLALGHAFGCLDHLRREAAARPALEVVVQALSAEIDAAHADLLAAAGSAPNAATQEQLRTRATDLALRCSQALLTTSKGAGFAAGHPAERLAREAMFFLVWSCPQAVATKLLNNFGGCDAG